MNLNENALQVLLSHCDYNEDMGDGVYRFVFEGDDEVTVYAAMNHDCDCCRYWEVVRIVINED